MSFSHTVSFLIHLHCFPESPENWNQNDFPFWANKALFNLQFFNLPTTQTNFLSPGGSLKNWDLTTMNQSELVY